jgi:hypothetical protein
LSAIRTGRIYPSGNIPGTHFCEMLSQPHGPSVAGRIVPMKNSNETIGNRTRDIPTCSAVPHTNCATACPFSTLYPEYFPQQFSSNALHQRNIFSVTTVIMELVLLRNILHICHSRTQRAIVSVKYTQYLFPFTNAFVRITIGTENNVIYSSFVGLN